MNGDTRSLDCISYRDIQGDIRICRISKGLWFRVVKVEHETITADYVSYSLNS